MSHHQACKNSPSDDLINLVNLLNIVYARSGH